MKTNVDQFALDTNRRKWMWSAYRRHPLSYMMNRAQWYLYPYLQHVPKFPIHVDFESASVCNLSCPMCYRPHLATKTEGLMDFDMYKKAILECGQYGLYSIRLSWRGEPTLHPQLAEMVYYAKRAGIKEVSFLTNGFKLNMDLAGELIDAGLDYLSVSIDGMYETYEKIRAPSKFHDIVFRLKEIRRVRDQRGNSPFPRIRINSLWSAVKECKKEYYATFKPIVDYITINPDYDHSRKQTEIDTNHICQYLYQRLTVMWDGTVPLCICDKSKEEVLGNIATDRLYDLWRNGRMEQIRKLQIDGKTRQISPCIKCNRPVTGQIGHQRPAS